jgi:hypothetical protein
VNVTDFSIGSIKDYENGICCFFTRHAALESKSEDWLAWNRDNVSEWNNMPTCEPLSEETTNTIFIVFGFTRQGLKPTVYHHILDEYANHYTIDTVSYVIAWNRDNVSEWNNMPTCEPLLQ